MKRVLSATIGLAAMGALAGSASAADLPRHGPAPAAAPVYMPVAYNWTGFYAGINGGWGFGNSSWADNLGSTGDFDTSGAMVGGTIGYNWQNGPVVFGVETDLAWTDIDGTTSETCPLECKTGNGWLGTARGRLGYAVDRWMPFVSGGAAYGDIKASTPGFAGDNDSNIGWAVGAGAEVAVAGNWTAKGEYLYVDLGDLNCSAANCGGAGPIKIDFTTHVVRAGLNYRF
jgi:outer membrane immunogenic protein